MSTQIERLVREADRLGSTDEALQILQQAIQIADAENDTFLGLVCRKRAMWLARVLLRSDLLATAFSWSVAKYDESPDRYAEFNPLGEYALVIGLLANFPSITKVRIEGLLEDMADRYEAANWSLDNIQDVRWSIAWDFGDSAMAMGARNALKLKFSQSSEFLYHDVHHQLFLREEAEAIRAGERYLSGKLSSDDVCANLLMPLIRSGNADRAHAVYTRLSPLHNDVYYWPYGERMKYLVHTRKTDVAIRCYQRYQAVVSEHSDPLTKLYFYTDMITLFRELCHTKSSPLNLKLPAEVPVEHDNHQYSVFDLHDWIVGQARELAGQFDDRNGNSFYGDRFDLAVHA